jgi:hypothetical protein
VYVHQGIVSALAFRRPKNSAFWMAIRAMASAACVNWNREHTSPAAYTRRLLVLR